MSGSIGSSARQRRSPRAKNADMAKVVLDTSAMLAILFEEPGADIALGSVEEALCVTVNLTEILTRCIDRGFALDAAEEFIVAHGIEHVAFDTDLARLAASLRNATRQKGLSLGDRACLALAIRENATVVTADRSWVDLDVGCKIELIR